MAGVLGCKVGDLMPIGWQAEAPTDTAITYARTQATKAAIKDLANFEIHGPKPMLGRNRVDSDPEVLQQLAIGTRFILNSATEYIYDGDGFLVAKANVEPTQVKFTLKCEAKVEVIKAVGLDGQQKIGRLSISYLGPDLNSLSWAIKPDKGKTLAGASHLISDFCEISGKFSILDAFYLTVRSGDLAVSELDEKTKQREGRTLSENEIEAQVRRQIINKARQAKLAIAELVDDLDTPVTVASSHFMKDLPDDSE